MSNLSLYWVLFVIFKNICIIKANWITGNLCWSMPCLNGGSCFGSAYTYLCVCPVDYSGVLCEHRIGPCQENPCGNRGRCIEASLTTFECECYFGYMGSICSEIVPRNQSNLWSSLLPVHTQILFDILQESYNAKLKDKPSSEIDFTDLVTTSTLNNLPDVSTTTIRTELEETEFVINAEEIDLKKIFSDVTTIPTTPIYTDEEVDYSDNSTVFYTTTVENITSTSIGQTDQTLSDTTESASLPTTSHETSTDIDTNDSTEAVTTSSDIDPSTVTESDNPTTTIFADTTQSYPLDPTSITPSVQSEHVNTTSNVRTASNRLLRKLCRRILSQIFPSAPSVDDVETGLSLPLDSLSANNNNTFLYWIQKHLNISTNPVQTSTSVPLAIDNLDRPSAPLQRIDIDDVLHQMNSIHQDFEH
ncbi:unnamed protein product [Adineta ricciae]|uniref:EGF-like domain-containing protein n=1 Tax=Adineta ricciae TaxID=249248 RepID=A0A813RKT4_ADIRI|nr:unnamed protein product [Adineta ricciae]